MPYINDNALDDLLQYIIDNATDLHVCSTEPTTKAEADTTYTLGNKTGITVGAIGDATPNGRKITISAITDGSVTGNGTVAAWGIISLTELLAANAVATSKSVNSGDTFTTTAFDITVPDAVSA